MTNRRNLVPASCAVLTLAAAMTLGTGFFLVGLGAVIAADSMRPAIRSMRRRSRRQLRTELGLRRA